MHPLPSTLTVAGLIEGYRQRRWRPSQVLAEVAVRVAADPGRSVWISKVPADDLQRRAAQIEDLLDTWGEAAFARWPLLGVPCAVKDNIDVAGQETTAACPDFAFTPPASADVVAALEAAGAVVVGKTNLDQFATGLVGTRSPYGQARNPFDPAYISGGSSSGSAVATAQGQVAFALGTDTAGSGRVPAALCNLVGLKPTPGLASTRGVFPACRSLDCVSVFAHTVSDAWRVLSTLAPTRDEARVPAMLGPLMRHVRLGLPAAPEFFGDALARAAFEAAVGTLAHLEQHRVDMEPFHAVADLLYGGPWIAERRAALGTFFEDHAAAIDPTVHRLIARADTMRAADVFVGQQRLAELKHRCDAVFGEVDVLIVPSVPTVYSTSQIADEPIELNARLGLYTNFVNLLGYAALTLPGPFRADGLPAGITLIAPGGADHRLAELARRLEPLLHGRLGTSDQAPPRRQVPLPPLPFAEPTLELAVVGAHLSGLPLNWQLVERGARLKEMSTTSVSYRLFALAGTVPPKPGLQRVSHGGAAIDVEVWELPMRHVGSFLAGIPSPLCLGTLQLADGREVKGFLCEASACEDARDITEFGGWRGYLDALRSLPPQP